MIELPNAIRSHPVRWYADGNREAWARRAADAVATALQEGLENEGRALLVVAAGNTALTIYRKLAAAPLPWHRVTIALAEERWTTPGSTHSNETAIRGTLLTGLAAHATLLPLVQRLDDPDLAAREAARQLQEMAMVPSAVVLGMDDDGHVAGLFARAGGIDHALASSEPYAAIDALGCEGAGRWPTRITVTPALIQSARQRFLVLQGASRRRSFEQALTDEDWRSMSVRCALAGHGPLQVHWCP
ncbi:6-phosphogluconolactonase [Pseudofulvimonas gallinarii]|uniref:6-phosphogluconolactonase n=1 Tax=Pseudofulvimonas gallinarii TaxID=634155 RepID=A0A4R3L970_9GAMM|nr:6-phosphogluconolactonase [Pseudofulvimonas gallinarii]TCS94046.1 6-phosphogluconolactonase [Pseudofulvimonas gallinarii]THD13013.1 hypothetical protein B1808_10225 [Pseudofulvimonas gallinarii]